MQQKRQEAATIIQNTWRKYRKRKIAKEKLRKLKKQARESNPVKNGNNNIMTSK